MNVVNYLEGDGEERNEYPLTLQGMDFVQGQIMTAQQASLIGGDCYILRPENGKDNGIAVLNGEILPISNRRASNSTHLYIAWDIEDIEVDRGSILEAREIHKAKWVVYTGSSHSSYIPVSDIKEFKTNVELTELVKSLQLSVGKSMPVEKGKYTLSALATKITPMRIMCEEGSEVVDGHKEYSVDVYVGANNIVRQILTTKDGSRYIRHLVDDNTKNFTKIDKPRIELRVVDGHLQMRKNFWVDESGQDGTGDVAEVGATDLSIILLRKKRRSRNAGRNRVNGTRRVRAKRQGWAHAWSAKINNVNGANTWTDVLIESCKLPPSGMGGVIISDAPPSASFERNSKVYDFLSKILIPQLLPRQGVRLKGGKAKKKGGVFAKFAIAVVRGDYRKVSIEDLAEFKFWFYRHPDHSLLTAVTV